MSLRRLESEQQSEADLVRLRNLCAVLAVVIDDIETDRASDKQLINKHCKEKKYVGVEIPQSLALVFSIYNKHLSFIYQ